MVAYVYLPKSPSSNNSAISPPIIHPPQHFPQKTTSEVASQTQISPLQTFFLLHFNVLFSYFPFIFGTHASAIASASASRLRSSVSSVVCVLGMYPGFGRREANVGHLAGKILQYSILRAWLLVCMAFGWGWLWVFRIGVSADANADASRS